MSEIINKLSSIKAKGKKINILRYLGDLINSGILKKDENKLREILEIFMKEKIDNAKKFLDDEDLILFYSLTKKEPFKEAIEEQMVINFLCKIVDIYLEKLNHLETDIKSFLEVVKKLLSLSKISSINEYIKNSIEMKEEILFTENNNYKNINYYDLLELNLILKKTFPDLSQKYNEKILSLIEEVGKRYVDEVVEKGELNSLNNFINHPQTTKRLRKYGNDKIEECEKNLYENIKIMMKK